MKKILITSVLLSLVSLKSNAQVYANDSLKTLAELNTKSVSLNLSTGTGQLPQNIRKTELPDVSTSYRSTNVEAANFDPKHTPSEIAAFKDEAQRSAEKFIYYIDLVNGQLIRQNRATKAFKTFQIASDNSTIRLVNCDTCDPVVFRIIEKSDTHLIIADKAQDEGQVFEFILSFSK